MGWSDELGSASQKPSRWSDDLATPVAPVTEIKPNGVPLYQRVIRGINDPMDAMAQMMHNATPAPIRNAVNRADNWLYQATGGKVGTAPGNDLNAALAQREGAYQQARGDGIDWGRAAGGAISGIPMAAMLPQSSSVAGNALAGALYGGMSQPVNEGDYATEKAKQMAYGAAGGGALSAIGNGISRLISPNISPNARALMDAGVNLTPGQIMGGSLKRLEDGATSVPFLGDMVKNAQRRAAVDLNTVALNRSLKNIGEKLPPGLAGYEAVDHAANRVGDVYNSVLAKTGAIRPDAEFHAGIDSLSDLTKNLGKDKAEQFANILKNEIKSRIDENGVMMPDAWKAADSNLGALWRGYRSNQDYDTRQLGTAILEAQNTMRNMLGRVKPESAADLTAANKAYADLLRVERAASMVGAKDGVFSAEQLNSAVKALDPSKNKNAFARGIAPMQDLSRPARDVLGATVPDSGTPFRSMIPLMATALAGKAIPESAPYAFGATALGGAAMLPYTSQGQKLAQALLASRPEGAKALAGNVERVLPFLVPAAVQGAVNQ